MKTFTIDANNQISVFSSKKEAAAASVTPFDAFANQSEFAELSVEWPMQRLVGLWNSLPGVNLVSKFTSRKIAIERLWKALQGLDLTPRATEQEATVPAPEMKPAESQEVPAEPQQPEETPVVAEAQQPEELPAIVEAPQPEAPAAAETAPMVQSAGEAPSAASPAEPVADAGAQVADATPVEAAPAERTTRAKKAPKASQRAKVAKSDGAPREGSKTAQVVAMLQRKGGVTISEIMSTMGWQKHTVRGFMAGAMKKAGYEVESFKPEGGERSYRINQ